MFLITSGTSLLKFQKLQFFFRDWNCRLQPAAVVGNGQFLFEHLPVLVLKSFSAVGLELGLEEREMEVFK